MQMSIKEEGPLVQQHKSEYLLQYSYLSPNLETGEAKELPEILTNTLAPANFVYNWVTAFVCAGQDIVKLVNTVWKSVEHWLTRK